MTTLYEELLEAGYSKEDIDNIVSNIFEAKK